MKVKEYKLNYSLKVINVKVIFFLK